MFKKINFASRIAFSSALLSTIILTIVLKRWNISDLLLSLCIFLILFLIVFIITIFNNHQLYKQITELYDEVFQLKRTKKISVVQYLREITKEVKRTNKEKGLEIVNLTERENYRREFLGNVSHELKTPLFSIQGFLLTLIEGGVNDENIRDKYLNRINKSVERLSYIVRDLDMISELERGKIKIAPKPFNIVAVTQEVFDLLEMKAHKNDIELRFNQFYDNIKVIGDLEKIEQVMVNLIVNAVKHSNKEGSKVTVSFETEAQRVKIIVKDDGQGIPFNEQKRIFERFYRVEKSRNRKKGGSGLGLSIVKHILEAHGEKIYLESEINQGTSFYFYLKKI